MGRRKTPGLRKRGQGVWHIEKQILGILVCESTGTSNLKEAELILARRIEAIRKAKIYGERPRHLFRDAATKYLNENLQLASIKDYAQVLKKLDPYIGSLTLDKVHLGTLQTFINDRRKDGVKNKTINVALSIVRRILNLAARLWRDENGLTWLETSPLIQMLPMDDARKPYPLTWSEQRALLKELPDHLAAMTLFKVNTGTREQEICQLRWEWEVEVPELNTSVFLVPGHLVKNRDDRLVVLNTIAKSVIDTQRGKHDEFVFVSKGKPVRDINNSGWQRSRIRAAFELIRQDQLCESLEECVYRKNESIIAKVSCKRSGQSETVEVTYTLEEHEQDRAKRGYPKLRDDQLRARGLLQIIRYKAIRRFLDQQSPELSAFSRVRVHDLKHTFGRRLRAAGVGLETRKVLLGHRSNDITSHYSAVELPELIQAVEKVSANKSGKTPALTLLRRKSG